MDILTESEKKLKRIIVEAVTKGDYTTVDAGSITAAEISKLKVNLETKSKQHKNSIVYKTSMKEKKLSQSFKPQGYPRYEIQNNTLVRTGWSKKEQDDYTHIVPKEAFESIIMIMEDLAKGKVGPIKAEEIIDTINNTESFEIPSYQVYVVIGLLRQRGYIKKIGRKGYEIPQDIKLKAKKEWISVEGEKQL